MAQGFAHGIIHECEHHEARIHIKACDHFFELALGAHQRPDMFFGVHAIELGKARAGNA
jgi:hypothetical protein